ncbi:hypothetical protein RSSM_03292 [Rhodopirellula sallentina SM41]|uniref:Uncharacterized protein n=1 Tax=Rhodopirellula sallentina SM41 TaxID=1263870 RepID=M5UGX4_9BACT|nr:hypothetical protein RSSM_03292 [Rhodopirellula sallentina SM41]
MRGNFTQTPLAVVGFILRQKGFCRTPSSQNQSQPILLVSID